MKVIVCFGETRVLVPCEQGDMTMKELTEQAVARYKKATNKSADEEVKVACLKTQTEGAVVDPDDKVHELAEDRDVFTAVCDEPFTQLVNANNGQLVLAVIGNDGTINSDSILHTMQLNQSGNSMSNLSPLFSNAVEMLQQSMSQQGTGALVNALASTVPALEEERLGVEDQSYQDDKYDKNDFKCDQCPKKFKQSSKLRQHLIAHARQEEMKKYECDKCAASFCSEWLMRRHVKIHTGKAKPRFCLVCNRAFRGSTDLKVHMRVHTGEKPFKCEHCPKAFGDSSALRRHTMTHTGLKPRPCPHCPLAFRQTAPLIQHMRTKHDITFLHRCDVCFMSFCEDDSYVMHMANVHHKDVSVLPGDEGDQKKDESGEMHAEMQDEEASGGEVNGGTVQATEGEVAAMVEDGRVEEEEHGDKNEHLVEQNEEEKDDEEEKGDDQEIAHDEQVVAETSIQEGFMAEGVEQGHRITISTGQENHDIVLPSELIVAHQLIAVQQSNTEVQ